MFDLISIGDAAIDHFFQISDAHLENDEAYEELCLKFGDKLPVQVYQQCLGGNNANNVVGAARLNLKTAVYLNVGEDLAGKFTLETLKAEGVDTKYVVANKGMDSNASCLISFKGERTILTYHQDFKYQLPDLEPAKWVYISSMGKSAQESNFQAQIENYLERTRGNLLFNPGTLEIKNGLKKYPRILSLTKLLIVNKEEAEKILKIDEGSKTAVKKLLQELTALGPEMVIVTDGSKGSFSFDGKDFWKLDIFPAQVVDMTGAGDAYATAVLAGIFHNKSLVEAMRWGTANAASVVGAIGAQKGLLTYDKMQEKLQENFKVVAKLI